ncbi:helix-turn-helix domain-containing protein [Modicisalibacter muralis]|uniref:helix-turn-helix domain-containing protein n=1 Tax=Modicisalibacter muralis TaxID=119000 RepID=UPI0015872CE9
MSLAAMHWARQSLKTLPDDVKTPSRLALMLLADYADESHVCWPSIGTMALEMGCSRRSVQRAVDVLETRGLLTVQQRQAANGRQQSNRYRLTVGGGCQSVTPTISAQSGEGDNLTPYEGDKLTGEGVTRVRGRVSPVSPLESTTRPLTSSHSGAGESIFEQAARRTDDGEPLPTTERQYPMPLDWQPDPEHLAAACQRAGLPADTQPATHQLAKFTAHHADQPSRRHGAMAWTAKLVDWIRNDQRQQAQQPTGGAHGNRQPAAGQRQRFANVSAAEARRLAEQQRRDQDSAPPGGAGRVYDGEFVAGDGGNR